MVGREKLEELLIVSQFLLCLQFLIKFNKTAVLRRNQHMSDKCGDRWAIGQGGWLETRWEMRPAVSTSIWAFPKVYPLLSEGC
jgi:hypothetical protein